LDETEEVTERKPWQRCQRQRWIRRAGEEGGGPEGGAGRGNTRLVAVAVAAAAVSP